jgi:hypothetical protein
MTTNLTKEVPKCTKIISPFEKPDYPPIPDRKKTSKSYKSTGIRSKTSYGIMIMGKTFQDLQKSRIAYGTMECKVQRARSCTFHYGMGFPFKKFTN